MNEILRKYLKLDEIQKENDKFDENEDNLSTFQKVTKETREIKKEFDLKELPSLLHVLTPSKRRKLLLKDTQTEDIEFITNCCKKQCYLEFTREDIEKKFVFLFILVINSQRKCLLRTIQRKNIGLSRKKDILEEDNL